MSTRSPADVEPRARTVGGGRSVIEWCLHVLAIVLVAWAWWRTRYPPSPRVTAVVAERDGGLTVALRRWTTGADVPAAAYVRFSGVPDATTREWLAAVDRAGTRVTWGGDGGVLPATAIDVEPVADPIGHVRIALAAPRGSSVVVSDAFGTLDSAVVARGLVEFRGPPPAGALTAAVGATVARAEPVDSLTLRRVYVVGQAGWETKFVVRALEDEGWMVDARMVVTPTHAVASAVPVELDTARYAAVVAIDAAVATDGGRVARYVAQGGGLVIAPAAAAAMPALAVGTQGDAINGAAVLADSAPRRGLTLVPIARLAPGAETIERRDALTTVADRLVGKGRVVQIGYADSWRWRMAAGDSGAAAFREWWAGLVARVAAAPATARPSLVDADPAPYVATVERLGGPVAPPSIGSGPAGSRWPAWVFSVLMVGLVAEWGSRRWRGAR